MSFNLAPILPPLMDERHLVHHAGLGALRSHGLTAQYVSSKSEIKIHGEEEHQKK